MPSTVLQFAKQQVKPFKALLRRFVEIESPSHDKAAVDRAVHFIAAEFGKSGGRVRFHRQKTTGDVLQIDFGGKSRSRLLLLGHVDTVWEIGTLKSMPCRESAGKLYGPGVFDMKFGVVQMLFAIRLLQQIDGKLPRNLTVLLNPDEELGSHNSRAITEELALKSDAVLVFEPSAGATGACKTSRKGVGNYLLRVKGIAAHAGLDFQKGASAITELAHQLTRITTFSDPAKGLTINPGIIRGGTRLNVVADQAEAEIDARVVSAAQVRSLDRRLQSLKPMDRRCQLDISGGINRLPFERNAKTVKLYRQAKSSAEALAFELPEVGVGGGSDGNFTAGLGVPTLDGLGAVGDGAHAIHEHVVEREIPRRVALAAELIRTIRP
jgi:glutamate carboxypeptidase